MDNGRSEKVLNLYMKANDNKNKIVSKVTGHRPFSEAEVTVLSCLLAIARDTEMNKLPYLEKPNYDEIIKIILIKSLEGKTDGLKKKDEYDKIIKDYENIENYTYESRTFYHTIFDNIYPFYNPVYPEEQFISQNLDLQDIIRKGHIYWGVKGDRIESILEHVYGCCVLALGIESEYGYSIDYNKVIKMLLLHETGEILIGDLTEWDISKERKEEIEKNAVKSVFNTLSGGKELVELLDEFNHSNSIEATYARLIDKLEYDLQVKSYELNNRYDYNNVPSNVVTNSNSVRNIMKNANSVFEVHYEYDKDRYTSIPCMRMILEKSKNL